MLDPHSRLYGTALKVGIGIVQVVASDEDKSQSVKSTEYAKSLYLIETMYPKIGAPFNTGSDQLIYISS
jgi:hypothetical protein